MYKEPQEVEINKVSYFTGKKKLTEALKSTGRDRKTYNWSGRELRKLEKKLNQVKYLISKFEIVRRITGT